MSDFVLPEEIMLCILTRLPVKSIIRFKSVCKSWRLLFGTHEFMKMHYDQFSTDPQNQNFIIYILTNRENPRTPLSLGNFDQTLSIVSIGSVANEPTNLDVSYSKMQDIGHEYFVGCCNGLICIRVSQGFVLWNPALKLFKYVSAQRFSFMVSFLDGLGYDSQEDDFKIVIIIFSVCMMALRAEVYSSKSDSWRTMDVGLQFDTLCQKTNNAIVNGNPYWVVCDQSYDWDLVRFDVSKMVFEMVPLSTIDLGHEEGLHIVNWKGSLAALVSTTDVDDLLKSVDVWVMNEGEMMWTKIHTIRPIGTHITDKTRFLQCSKGGEIVEYTGGKLIVIDPETGFVRSIKVSNVTEAHYFDICDYNEGLGFSNVTEAHYFDICDYNEGLGYVKGMLPQLIIPISDEN